jgi:hypothetical protein
MFARGLRDRDGECPSRPMPLYDRITARSTRGLWHWGPEHPRLPKMMSVKLPGRISGYPARAMALARFLDHAQSRDDGWVLRRASIARHWMAHHRVAQRGSVGGTAIGTGRFRYFAAARSAARSTMWQSTIAPPAWISPRISDLTPDYFQRHRWRVRSAQTAMPIPPGFAAWRFRGPHLSDRFLERLGELTVAFSSCSVPV